MGDAAGPLAGYRIGVTAERRRDEIAAILRRRGATVTVGSAIRLIPLVDDDVLRERTRTALADPCDVLIVTTGIGFRGWMDAADAWGLGHQLRETLQRTRILARGPKATGAIRSGGLHEEWTAPSESTDEVVNKLITEGVAGKRVGIQLHGLPITPLRLSLEDAGARVIEIPVYRWDFPHDLAPLDRMILDIAHRSLDAVVFTSALAVEALLGRAEHLALSEEFRAAMRAAQPWACCVGPVTAAALVSDQIPVLVPDRARLGDLLRMASDEIPRRLDQHISTGGLSITVRRDGYLHDGQFIALSETPMAILRELAARPGDVIPRGRLLALLPAASNDNALETAVARLRARLPSRTLVETVVKRGYRLAE